MRTLYVTDLDGTLLDSKDSLSEYTIETINNLVEKGMCFSYATARSLSSAGRVTKGLQTDIPVIVYNGTFIFKAGNGEVLYSLYFTKEEKEEAVSFLEQHERRTFVYSFVNGKERVSWLEGSENEGMLRYLSLRKGDKRLRPVQRSSDLFAGDIFYFTCIGEKEELLPIYDKFKTDEKYNTLFQQELYREEYWCELMPQKATKGNAILHLKDILKCDRVISFGDAINDIPMFSISDECYAVNNAVEDLKNKATGVIMSNDEDGVAHFLKGHVCF